MYDELETIEGTMKRSKVIIKRMARKVTTDKYIWFVIFLCVAAIIFIIVWKSIHPESNYNVPEDLRVPNRIPGRS